MRLYLLSNYLPIPEVKYGSPPHSKEKSETASEHRHNQQMLTLLLLWYHPGEKYAPNEVLTSSKEA